MEPLRSSTDYLLHSEAKVARDHIVDFFHVSDVLANSGGSRDGKACNTTKSADMIEQHEHFHLRRPPESPEFVLQLFLL
jgi:hypothetical protein